MGCHLSHGLTQEEAGQCNHTCAPLVGYMDDMSGRAGVIQFNFIYIAPNHNDCCLEVNNREKTPSYDPI